MADSFNEWYEKEGKQTFEWNGSYTLDDLKSAWSAAVSSCESIIADKYDEQEPWLEPGEVTEILKNRATSTLNEHTPRAGKL